MILVRLYSGLGGGKQAILSFFVSCSLSKFIPTRICPGRYFADASLWLQMSNILAVFDIGPPLDEYGSPQMIGEVKYTSGVTRSAVFFNKSAKQSADFALVYIDFSRPESFKCTIEPRNAKCAALIRGTEFEADF